MAIIPAGYQPLLNVMETQTAIKRLKDGFESCLAEMLHLTRVSAPLFVTPESGLNDMLNGVERPVSFDLGRRPAPAPRLCSPWPNGSAMRCSATASSRRPGCTPI